MYELIIERNENNLDIEMEMLVDRVVENNYNKLNNKPQINNIELVDNKTLEEIGIETLTNSN